jgi:LCP family protein required for cell wall assembly
MQRGYDYNQGNETTLPPGASPPYGGYDPTIRVRPQGNYDPPKGGRGAQPRVSPRPAGRGQQPKRRRWGRRIGIALLVVVLLLLATGGFAFQRAYAFGSSISTQSPLNTQINLAGTDRVNLLVMGFGGGNHPGAYLTDSMLIISILPQTGKTALISVPRDLWVQIPPNSGNYGKINAAYVYGLENGYQTTGPGKIAAGGLAARKISDVTGLPVNYWMTLDFQGFRQLVDALGGVDITVVNPFTALYPKNDDPNIDASYIKVHFDDGPQHMDGERAIEYARAREVLDNPAEGTDFARSARQQILIKAIVAKMTQVSSWPKLFNVLDALKSSIYTNLSARDLAEFVRKMDIANAKRIGLTNQNVLQDDTSDDGQYILVPKTNFSDVQQYIQDQLNS